MIPHGQIYIILILQIFLGHMCRSEFSSWRLITT